ncbi:MAG: hypothetical protein O3A00_26720 [Planctomycetota bacterium]|nr:hypothetical protein [Planctomycetota bacterium]
MKLTAHRMVGWRTSCLRGWVVILGLIAAATITAQESKPVGKAVKSANLPTNSEQPTPTDGEAGPEIPKSIQAFTSSIVTVTRLDPKTGKDAPNLNGHSGVVVDPRGYIVTPMVDAQARTMKFKVWMAKDQNFFAEPDANDQSGNRSVYGQEFVAELVASDETLKLMILKVQSPRPLVAVSFAKSREARVGDKVLLVTSPLSRGKFDGRVTSTSFVFGDPDSTKLIQTDVKFPLSEFGSLMVSELGEPLGLFMTSRTNPKPESIAVPLITVLPLIKAAIDKPKDAPVVTVPASPPPVDLGKPVQISLQPATSISKLLVEHFGPRGAKVLDYEEGKRLKIEAPPLVLEELGQLLALVEREFQKQESETPRLTNAPVGLPKPTAAEPDARTESMPARALATIGIPNSPAAKQLVEQLAAQESAAAAEAATIRQLQANGQAEQNRQPIAEHQRKLKNLLSTAFDLKLQLEELQVKELQSRLSRLERQIGQRKELREKIINRRATELIEGDVLKWSVDSSQARPAQSSKIETGAAKAGNGFRSLGPTSAIDIPGPWLQGVTDLASDKTPKELPMVRFEVRSRVTNFTLESGEKSDIVAVHYYRGVCVSPDGLVAMPHRDVFHNALQITAVGPVEIDAEVVAQDPIGDLSLLRLKRPLPGISFVALDSNPPGMMQIVQLCFPNRMCQAVTIESIDRRRNSPDPKLPLEDRMLLLRHDHDLNDSGLPVMSLSNRLVGLTRPEPGMMRDPETRTAKEPRQLVLLSAIPAVFIERLIAEYRAKQPQSNSTILPPPAKIQNEKIVIDIYGGSQVLPGLGTNPGYSKLVQNLNALNGVTVNFREAGKGAVIVMAIVRDPSQRCHREASQTQKESELRIAINSALKSAGIEVTQWEEGTDAVSEDKAEGDSTTSKPDAAKSGEDISRPSPPQPNSSDERTFDGTP